jgi:transposase
MFRENVSVEIVTLNRKEQKRLLILNQIEKKEINVKEAAPILELSERQVWRMLAGYRKEGVSAIAHGNRGRKPANTLEDNVKLKIVEPAQFSYRGFNHQHFTEKLNEKEEISISRSAVRRILLQEEMSSPRKRRPPKHRSRRERYPREGMLLQTDGSDHDWLEDLNSA